MMQYLKSVTSIHPGTVIKMYATDKNSILFPCVIGANWQYSGIHSIKMLLLHCEICFPTTFLC